MTYILVGLLQIIQSIFKVYEIKWSYEDQTTKLTTLSFLMAGVWLLTTTIGVNAVLGGDWVMMIVYILSGGIGKILAIRMFKQNKYRTKLFKSLKEYKKD